MRDAEEERGVTDGRRDVTTSRRWLIWAGLVVVAFLLGLLPMWWSKSNVSAELERARVELQRQEHLNSLSAAAVYARRGEYETSRQYASKFFTDMQAELDNAESKVLTPQDRMQLPQLLANRDDIITLLSRADPASAERLSNLFVEYRAATGGVQQ
jgi:hypothetical protein